MAKTRPDVDTIRQAMEGRGAEILAAVCGIPRDSLDGLHHPCPKCGGKDRFRYDAAKEFALCNQCFNTKNGDILAAVQWALGCDFLEAATKLGEYLGVKPLKGGKKKDPEADLEFGDWSSALFRYFASERPGISEEALRAFGARQATYKKRWKVYALPIIGGDLDPAKPVGWVVLDAMGGKLPKWDRSGAMIGRVKTKVVYGSDPGLVGVHALERLPVEGLPEIVWKAEGITDALAIFTAIPPELRERHLVVTNANGAGEDPKWMAGALARSRPVVLHDADKPGEAGAKKWAIGIAQQGVAATIARLPYEIEPDHGKDARHFLTEDRGKYSQLLEFADKGEVVEPPDKKTEKTQTKDLLATDELILSKLKLVVLYETNDNRVRVFSTHLKKSSTIEPERLSETKLISIAGHPARVHVSSDPDGENSWGMSSVREAIAVLGAYQRGRHLECGVGVWRGVAKDGSHTDSLVIANNTEAAVYSKGELRQVEDPRAEGITLDFGDEESADWFNFEQLKADLAAADDLAWRRSVVEQAEELFARWKWTADKTDPLLVTGLVMATWVQSLWAFRPMVAILGESNTGKSSLFDALGGESGQKGLFHALAYKAGKGTTEAGVRQGIRHTGRAVLLDEFEKSRERDKILESLRNASRSDIARKGSSGQKSIAFSMRHIVWIAAIESGLRRQPDINRFIQITLERPEKPRENALTIPPPSELVALGRRLLAAALAVCLEARDLAASLKRTKVEGAAARQVEAYAVPASILGLAVGHAHSGCEGLLRRLMLPSLESGEPEQSDQEALREAILTATVRRGGDELSVDQIIEGRETSRGEWLQTLEAHGVKATECGRLAIHRQTVARHLLKGTEWEHGRIDQILMRLPGAERRALRVGGGLRRVVIVPMPDSAETPQEGGQGPDKRNSATEAQQKRNADRLF